VTPDEIRSWLRFRPFQPFRICTTDGAYFDIRHPEIVSIGRAIVRVGVSSGTSGHPVARDIALSMLHLIRIEPLEEASPTPES
jgi:hypothetical protein